MSIQATAADARAVSSQLEVQLHGLADDIVNTIRGGTNWRPLQNGIAAAQSVATGRLVIGGLKGSE